MLGVDSQLPRLRPTGAPSLSPWRGTALDQPKLKQPPLDSTQRDWTVVRLSRQWERSRCASGTGAGRAASTIAARLAPPADLFRTDRVGYATPAGHRSH